MPDAVVDANVVYGARMLRDQYHDRASAIVEGMDSGDPPRGQVTDYALLEVLTPIQHRAGHDRAVETLEFLTESGGFRIRHLARSDFDSGRALFRRVSDVELSDAITVAYMRRTDVQYVYSFDDDFDRFDGITRLTTPEDPFAPS